MLPEDINRLIEISNYITPGVQNTLGDIVASVYRSEFQRAFPAVDINTVEGQQFFKTFLLNVRSPLTQSYIERVVNTPVDLSNMQLMGPYKNLPPGVRAQVEQGMGAVGGVTTVKQAQELLVRSLQPGFLTIAAEEATKGTPIGEAISNAVTGFLNGLPNYDPKKGFLQSYGLSQAFGLSKAEQKQALGIHQQITFAPEEITPEMMPLEPLDQINPDLAIIAEHNPYVMTGGNMMLPRVFTPGGTMYGAQGQVSPFRYSVSGRVPAGMIAGQYWNPLNVSEAELQRLGSMETPDALKMQRLLQVELQKTTAVAGDFYQPPTQMQERAYDTRLAEAQVQQVIASLPNYIPTNLYGAGGPLVTYQGRQFATYSPEVGMAMVPSPWHRMEMSNLMANEEGSRGAPAFNQIVLTPQQIVDIRANPERYPEAVVRAAQSIIGTFTNIPTRVGQGESQAQLMEEEAVRGLRPLGPGLNLDRTPELDVQFFRGTQATQLGAQPRPPFTAVRAAGMPEPMAYYNPTFGGLPDDLVNKLIYELGLTEEDVTEIARQGRSLPEIRRLANTLSTDVSTYIQAQNEGRQFGQKMAQWQMDEYAKQGYGVRELDNAIQLTMANGETQLIPKPELSEREILGIAYRKVFGIENPVEYKPQTYAMEHVIEAEQNLAGVSAIRQNLPRGAFYTQDFLANQISKGGGTDFVENLNKWNPEQGRVSNALWRVGQDTANSAKFQAASTAMPISREAKIVLEASEFAKQFGIGIVRETGKVDYTAGVKGEKILLGQDFFSDEIAKNPDVIFEYGRQTPERLRKLIMAHEIGHALASPHTEIAMEEVLSGQSAQQRRYMQDYIASAKEGLASWQTPGVEMAADVIAYGLGYKYPRQTKLWGLSDEQLDNLSAGAIKDALEFGKLTESQAKILMSHLGEEVRVDRIARRPSPEEEANTAFADIYPTGGGEYEELGQDYMARQQPSVAPRIQTGFGTAYAGEGRGMNAVQAQASLDAQRSEIVPPAWKDVAREITGRYNLQTQEAKTFKWGTQQTTPSGTQFISESTGEVAFSAQETAALTGLGKDIFSRATSKPFAQNITPTDLLATVNTRIYDEAKEYWRAAFQNAGTDLAKTTGVFQAKELTAAVTKDLMDNLSSSFEQQGARVGNFRGLAPSSVYLGTDVEKITGLLGQPGGEEYDRYVAEAGGAAAVAGGPPSIFTAGGVPFQAGGGGGGGGGRGRSIWGRMGQMGQGLYAAYLARRFWMMTAAPVGAEMAVYEQMQAQIAPMAGAQDLRYTAGGATQEAAAFQQWMGEGAYQQYGGLAGGAQAAIMATGSAGAGLIATGRVAAGIGIGTAMLAGPMGQMMLGEGAANLTPLGMIAAGAVAGAGIGVWAGNLVGRATQPGWTEQGLGDAARTLVRGMIVSTPFAAGSWLANKDNPFAQWLIGPAPQTPAEEILTKSSTLIASITGEQQNVAAQLETQYKNLTGGTVRAPGDMTEAATQKLIMNAKAMGVSDQQLLNQASSYAAGMGLMPGLPAYGVAMDIYQQMSPSQKFFADQKNATIARYAGEISPYFSNAIDATNFAWRQNLTTQGATAPYQSLMGAINTGYGVNFSNQAAAQYAGNLAQQYGPQAGGMPGQIVSTLALAAPQMGWQQAAGMYGQYNMNPVSSQGYLQAVNRAQQFQDILTPQQANQLAGYTTALPNAYQRDLAQQMAGGITANTGMPYSQAMGMLPANATDWQMGMLQKMQGGDISAISYMAWQGNNPAGKWLNQAGQPIYTTDMNAFMQLGAAQANLGNPAAMTGFVGAPAGAAGIQQWLGNQGVNIPGGLADALATGGTRGAAAYQSQQQLGFTLASVGVGMRGIALQENYLWGGGTPTQPGAGSAWAMEDQMRSMQYQQQMNQFAYSYQRMDTANQFQVQQEQITGQRMGAVQGFQRWQMGFERQGDLQQRQWTQQDWTYNQQMRSQQFGWQMEDIDLAIRQSSGRERQQLVKEKGRLATTYGEETGHIDEVQKRQEQLWAREDERYNKTKTYSEHLMVLDKQSFDLNQKQRETFYKMDRDHLTTQLKEYQDQKKLQDEIIAHQREYQVEQLKLQKESLGIQAAAAISANTYQQAMLKIEQSYDDQLGTYQEMIKNDPTFIEKITAEFFKDINKTDPNKVTSLKDAVKSFNVLDGSKTGDLRNTISSINSLNIDKLREIVGLIHAINSVP